MIPGESNGFVMSTFSESAAAKTALALSVLTIVGFGVYCVIYTGISLKGSVAKDYEEFITARGSSSKWKIAWSFFGSAVGSWVVAAVADYAFWAGILGSFFYAFSAGFPIVLIAMWGEGIRTKFPTVLSITDFALLRFGIVTQWFVVALCLFNMGIACAAEYTTLSALFRSYVGINDYSVFIVVLMALVTMGYTLYGGLRISIVTDQVQAIAAVIFAFVIAVYMIADWRFDESFEPDQDLKNQLLGKTETGYSSIFTMPLSLVTATVFSEAMWQRVWASEDKQALRFGAFTAFLMIFIVVMFFGAIGILGGWAGYVGYDTDPNLRVFYTITPTENANGIVNSAIGVVILILAVTMSESAVDSFQNGMGASLTGAIAKYFSDKHTLFMSRVVVVVLNVPLVIVGSLNLKVINLFLITNMLCTCGAFPIMLGFSENTFLLRCLTDWVPLTSFVLSLICLVIYGTSQVYDSGMSFGSNLSNGISMAFYDNFYTWDYFAVAIGSSIGITGVLLRINSFLVHSERETARMGPDSGTRSPVAEDLDDAIFVQPDSKSSIAITE